jgi:SAM-dependent methyltransferase
VALAQLRRKAVAKFAQPADLYFTAEALEQATAAPVAAHRAMWIDRCAPSGALLDLGCGIGGDLLALAQRRPVIAYEVDPVCARFAAANAAVLGLADRVEIRNRDWTADLANGALPSAAAAFADPARRVDGRRVFRLEQLTPPFSALLALADAVAAIGVKVMPGIADADIPAGWGVEFVSHAGVCKEAVLWRGAAARHPRWATVIGADGTYTAAADSAALPVGPLHAGQVLYEPDPALIRAHALGALGERLGARLFDPQIAYLVADAFMPEIRTQAFLVEEIHPFHLERLNERLHGLRVAQVELKKRGFPIAPETLRPKLRLASAGRTATVIFTRRGDERLMLICRRLSVQGATNQDE